MVRAGGGVAFRVPFPTEPPGIRRAGMTDRESKICHAALAAVRSRPQQLKDVAEFVNRFFLQEHLGNPVSEAGIAAVVGKFGRATIKQFIRDGRPWFQSLENPLHE
jgi:hypothetical protein